MAKLYVKTPNGTTKSIDLETMNITTAQGSSWTNQYTRFPNGLLIQYGMGGDDIADGYRKTTLPIAYGGAWYYRVFITAMPDLRAQLRFGMWACNDGWTKDSFIWRTVDNSWARTANDIMWLTIG